MSKEFLGDRERALEGLFFHQRDRLLLENLRRQLELQAKKESLRASSGIADDTVLDEMVALDIGPDAVAALSLIPLVVVAWANDRVTDKERNAVLSAAADSGLAPADPSYRLLEQWLETRPGDQLLTAWKDYVRALIKTHGTEATQNFRNDVLGRARQVAEASGGILGLGSKISRAENQVLNELEAAFEGG